jgi:hypothetical protein
MAFRNLLLRFIFGGLLAILSFLVARWKISGKLADWTKRQFDVYLVASYAACHFLFFFTAFFVLHQKPWADLVGVYVPQAHAVMSGLFPYRDFSSSYAPLNPYLDALILRVHDSPLSILVFQIVCDILSVPFWIRFLRRFMNEMTVRKAALLYFVQPLVAWEICIDGKNQGMVALFLGIAFWAMARREMVSGLSLSFTWIFVKFLPMMFVPTFFVAARKRATWLVTVVVPTVLVYGGFILAKADVTAGARRESNLVTPQNLPYLIGALTGYSFPEMVLSLLLLAAMGAALVAAVRAQMRAKDESAKLWAAALGTQLILLTFLIVNRKSDTSYLAMCFFLLCAFAAFDADRGRRTMSVLYVLLSWLSLPIASFWYWPLNRQPAVALHVMALSGNRSAWLMIAMQVLLVGSYIGLAWGMLLAAQNPEEVLMVHEERTAAARG